MQPVLYSVYVILLFFLDQFLRITVSKQKQSYTLISHTVPRTGLRKNDLARTHTWIPSDSIVLILHTELRHQVGDLLRYNFLVLNVSAVPDRRFKPYTLTGTLPFRTASASTHRRARK